MKMTNPIPPCKRDPSYWAWHLKRLQYLRDRLTESHDIHISAVIEPMEPHSMHIADSATDEIDHDMALSLLSNEENALSEVCAAIRRIRDGQYGICEESGRPIPAARLRAVPWTRYTREVEERLEKSGLVSRPYVGPATSIRGPRA